MLCRSLYPVQICVGEDRTHQTAMRFDAANCGFGFIAVSFFRMCRFPVHRSLRAICRVASAQNRYKKRKSRRSFFFYGDPWENRTPDVAVRGRSLNLLTNGPCFQNIYIIPYLIKKIKGFCEIFSLFFIRVSRMIRTSRNRKLFLQICLQRREDML